MQVIQEILEDMKDISGINALRSVHSLSESDKKHYSHVQMIRDITVSFFRCDEKIKPSIGGTADFIEHLVPTILNVGFCGEMAYRFILEYFRKTGKSNISLVVSLKYPYPEINHTFVIIGTNVEEKMKGLGYNFTTVFQNKCSKQDILVDPLTGQFCEIADRHGLQQFMAEYHDVSYVNTICSYHSKNILQQVINHDPAIFELAKKVRCKFNAEKLSEILRLLQKTQENKVFCLIGDERQELLVIPDDPHDFDRIKNYLISAGICMLTELSEVSSRILSSFDNLKVVLQKSLSTKCLIINKIERIDLDVVIYNIKHQVEGTICLQNASLVNEHDYAILGQSSKTSRSLQQPMSFFYHPHRMIDGHLVLGCDSPPGSIVDSMSRTVLPSSSLRT